MNIKVKTKEGISKYAAWIIILSLVLLSLLILKGTITALMMAFILAYSTRPIYIKMKDKLGPSFSAALCTVLIVTIFLIIFASLSIGLANEVRATLSERSFVETVKDISELPYIEQLHLDVDVLISKANSVLLSFANNFFTNYLPSLLLFVLVTLFATFYFLKNWEEIVKNFKEHMPFENKDKIFSEISKSTKRILSGFFVLMILEFLVAALGFYISGIRYYLLAASFVGFLAIIPMLGPTIVWVPMALFYLFTKQYYVFAGVVITGLILSGIVDGIFKNKYLGDRAKINPLIMLLGIIGGISVFGIVGFIIGPLVLYYALEVVKGIKI